MCTISFFVDSVCTSTTVPLVPRRSLLRFRRHQIIQSGCWDREHNVFTVTSEHRSLLKAHLPLDGRPSTTPQCSKLLYFRRRLDGPKVILTGQRQAIKQNLWLGDYDKSSIGHSTAGSEGTETVSNQASITQLVQLTVDLLTPAQLAARARRKHAQGRPRHTRARESR